MDQTVTLLKCIAENASTGADATEQLMKRTEDEELRRELMFQKDVYNGAQMDAEKRLQALGEKPDPKGPMEKMGMWTGIRMNTMTDRSNSHIADIMIQGVTMGVIEATKARGDNPDASAEAQGVASAFITSQQDAIERMKMFLS